MIDYFKDLRQQQREVRKRLLSGPYEHIDYRRIKERLPEEQEDDGYHTKESDWYSHALLLAQPGSGKTNVIRWRLKQLLPTIKEGAASVILMEPKGVLLKETLTLTRAEGMEDRVILIDPLYAPVSVNIFERGGEHINETIAAVTRIFGTISLALTDMQLPTMTFAVRALYAMPEKPSVSRLMDILRRGSFALDMKLLPETVRDFFEQDYKKPDRHIIGRLNTMFANPVYDTLFATDRPSFDIGKEMQAGKLIVINAGLSDTVYGQFWIEEIAHTIQSRLTIPPEQRTPTTFMIDEAQTFIAEDLHFAQILDVAREAKIGMLIAAHHMEQIKNAHVRNSLYNCALKFVARTNADIHNLCRSMGTTKPETLGTVPRHSFAFCAPDLDCAEIVKLPLVEFPAAKKGDFDFFCKTPEKPVVKQRPEKPVKPPPPKMAHGWAEEEE